jgi:hypothetical protein
MSGIHFRRPKADWQKSTQSRPSEGSKPTGIKAGQSARAQPFYETGIAHTLGRPVVPITQNAEDVPFDLHHHRYQRYLANGEGLQELTARLRTY